MNAASDRAAQIIDAIAGAFFSAAEAAANQISLSTKVAEIRTRMNAYSTVLELVGVQKAALVDRMATASGPLKTLYQQQIEMLTLQEIGILQSAGCAPAVAQLAVKDADASASATPTHKRDGRRFTKVNGVAPQLVANGAAGGE